MDSRIRIRIHTKMSWIRNTGRKDERDLALAAELYEVSPLEGGLAERRTLLLPVMFCRKMRGILRWQQSSMKWVPLRADWQRGGPSYYL
jgi:hypothetical protein